MHDDLCPITTHPGAITCLCKSPDGEPGLIARVRADEAARHHHGGDCECTSIYAIDPPPWPSWLFRVKTYEERLAAAEAVAARLVEVICDLDAEVDEGNKHYFDSLGQWLNEDTLRLKDLREARAERDAARAEVAALRERLDAFPMIGIELREADARREALADLRAKVAAEHDASLVGTDSDYELGRRQAYRRVLALFDEAAQ